MFKNCCCNSCKEMLDDAVKGAFCALEHIKCAIEALCKCNICCAVKELNKGLNKLIKCVMKIKKILCDCCYMNCETEKGLCLIEKGIEKIMCACKKISCCDTSCAVKELEEAICCIEEGLCLIVENAKEKHCDCDCDCDRNDCGFHDKNDWDCNDKHGDWNNWNGCCK